MARVTADEVKAVLPTNISDLSPFIETAELMIDETLAGFGLSEERLKKIALYLSAHFLSLRERQVKSEKIGDAAATYQGTTGMNLQSSLFGQTVLLLDTTGRLFNSGGKFAEFNLL